MNTKLRSLGIDRLGGMSWGTHFCLFSETREDLLDILIPAFKAGPGGHEFCLCVASGPVIAEEAERALREILHLRVQGTTSAGIGKEIALCDLI